LEESRAIQKFEKFFTKEWVEEISRLNPEKKFVNKEIKKLEEDFIKDLGYD
jgi:uncharacterized protein (UPF0335 family)